MARRPHALIYGALALSVALNLAGAGFLLASDGERKDKRSVDDTIELIGGRYPDTVGDAVLARLQSRRDEVARALGDMRAARRDSRAAMAGEPFDKAAVDAAFAESRTKTSAFQKVVHDAIAEAVAPLPAAERAKAVRGGQD